MNESKPVTAAEHDATLAAGRTVASVIKMFTEVGATSEQAINAAMTLFLRETCPEHGSEARQYDPSDAESVAKLLSDAKVEPYTAREAAAIMEGGE